jgi:hypothetical protein
MTFKTKASKIHYLQEIRHNANFSAMRTFHRRARRPEHPRFSFGYDIRVSLFVVRAFMDFPRASARRTNNDLSLFETLLNPLTSGG